MPRKPSAGSKRTASSAPVLPGTNPAVGEPLPPDEGVAFPIVALGASAGGLEAFRQFLQAVPIDTGMAFVVIQHLDPSHESMLAVILGRATQMPVIEVSNNLAVEPNRVYVIPPGKNMVYSHGLLQLAPRTEQRGQHRPIDHFMRSLAEEHGYKAIGVVLSGTASDGTLGLQEVKTAGGITFAQDGSAEQSGMPSSAVASGCVDLVLAPEAIAREIARIASHPLVAPPAAELDATLARNAEALRGILEILRDAFGVDFTNYKHNTLSRRITRRMVLAKLTHLEDYRSLLAGSAAEVEALYRDILINVTSFFRNPESYEALKEKVFPRLVRGKSRDDVVRVWTLGCSTGEEAYSVAMAYVEFAEATGQRTTLQIFATDVNGAGIEKARAGYYPKGITQDVSPERLKRFFVEADGRYRIAKPIRDMCVFARQNVLSDPPFSRLDLIACRNLLIYLEPVLQQRLVPLLHYSLRDGGMLWLGSSETIGSFRELFELEDGHHKFYARKPGRRRHVALPVAGKAPADGTHPARERPRPATVVPMDAQREADRLLISRYAPPGVVLDEHLDVLHFRGDTSPFLQPASGRASLNLLKMLKEGLLVGVRAAIQRCKREGMAVREDGLNVRSEGRQRDVSVVVMPLDRPEADGRLLVLFEAAGFGAPAESRAVHARSRERAAEAQRESLPPAVEIERLRQELAATRDYLQSVIEQQESANEELQAANEEVQSTNEELQSVNEELETSKEEIESTNEELSTVNEELSQRNIELAQSNDDLSNLIASVRMPIVLLDRELRIRRFTPATAQVLNLVAGDVARPIGDIKLPPDMADLDEDLTRVPVELSSFEREVRDWSGRWHLLRASPYRTAEDKADGVVVVLVDIDALKRSAQALAESEGRFHVLADSAPVLIWVNDLAKCKLVNRAFEEFVGIDAATLRESGWAPFVHADDRPQFLEAYRRAFERRQVFVSVARFRRADGVYRWTKSTGVPRFTESGELIGYVGSTVDIHDLKEAEDALRDADRAKNEFLGTLGHELRNPLAAMRSAVYLLAPLARQQDTTGTALTVIERQMGNMVRIVDDLLDVSRITQGKIQLRPEPVDLSAAARHAASATEHDRASTGQSLEMSVPAAPVWVRADAARLDQILGNLLNNASKFTPDGGRIWLHVEREAAAGDGQPGGTAVLRVRDNGLGIEPEMLPRIFELFVQGSHTTRRMRTGVGIGLTLVKRLVELHGGTIEARSAGRSKGSEFVVRLPLVATPDAERTLAPDLATAPAVQRMLLVDDNRDAIDAMQEWLGRAASEVRVAYDGTEALALAESFKPQVVLLDIGLPDMSGYDVARKLRAMPATRKALLIAITGFGRPEDIELGRDAGFDEHLTKPADPDRLMRLIGRYAAVEA